MSTWWVVGLFCDARVKCRNISQDKTNSTVYKRSVFKNPYGACNYGLCRDFNFVNAFNELEFGVVLCYNSHVKGMKSGRNGSLTYEVQNSNM